MTKILVLFFLVIRADKLIKIFTDGEIVEMKTIFEVLKKLLLQEDKPRNVVGFKIPKTKN